MAFRRPVDRRLVRAAGELAELPAAEAWRRLRALASELGVRPPSYPTVHRLLEIHRMLAGERELTARERELLLADVLAGRVPWRFLDARIMGRRAL
jgi:hypothetical protein